MILKLTQNNATALWNPNCGVESVNGIYEHIIRNSVKKVRIFQIVSCQLNYTYNSLQTHRGVLVCLDHLEPSGISFNTFEIQCFPDCVILDKASLR